MSYLRRVGHPIAWASQCALGQEDPVVDTIYGSIRGSLQSNDIGLLYEEYLGIPYASPPTGQDRFNKAREPEAWDDIIDTKEYGPHCVQFPPKPFVKDGLSNVTSEDCLFLNVYVPGENREGDNLAVIVYIHGGAFFQGTGALYPGYELSLHGDVIVVTINYRLGPLGFLTTEDNVAPGNMGLWDVKLALEWVTNNIDAFGGDVDRISVFGLSAGGAIVSHVMVSPQTDHLIARGAALSGASSGFFGTAQLGSAYNSTQALARSLGCRGMNTSADVVECLQDQDADDVNFWGFITVVAFGRQFPNFLPVIDGDFIPMDPRDMWNQSASTNKEFITGASIHDSGGFVMANPFGAANHTFNLAGTKELLDLTLIYATNHFAGDTDEMTEAIYDHYPDMASNDTTIRTQAATAASTDGIFDTWAHYEASKHSQSESSTYLYEYAYSNHFLKHVRNTDHLDWIIAEHGDDLYSLFGEAFRQYYNKNEWNEEFDGNDSLVSDHVMSYYTNFANNGNPNEGLEVPVEWSEYDTSARNYLQIREPSQTRIMQETEEMLNDYRFWNKQFYEIANPEDDSLDILAMDDDEFEYALQEAIEYVISLLEITYENEPRILSNVMDTIEAALNRRQ